MIRPQPTRWFSVVVARDDVLLALEALARTGAVELEPQTRDTLCGDPATAMKLFRDYGQLASRYRPYWPPVDFARVAAHPLRPDTAVMGALEALHRWAAEAEPVVARLQQLESEQAGLALWRAAAEHFGATLDLGALAHAGPSMVAALFVMRQDAVIAMPPLALAKQAVIGEDRYVVVVGAPGALAALGEQAAAQHGRRVDIPRWLQSDFDANLAAIAERTAACAREIGELRAELAALDERHRLEVALADMARGAWCFKQVGPVGGSEILARIEGWTSDPARIIAALDEAGARALADFPAPPAGAQPPLLLRNPRWVQPFELFSRMLGMPGRAGADPSGLLAIVAPLLFGYMFGDVGQGLVLLVAGLVLSRRMPPLRLLIAGGISAMAFGVLFGSVFSVERLIPALWLHPIAAPLPVLAVPLIGGAVLLALGLLIGALEAWWAHDLERWLYAEAGLVVVYVGLMLAFVDTDALYVAAAGLLWHLLGHLRLHRRLTAVLVGVLELIEKTIQILINTLSFVRVGAFALAHAGLSAAVVALANGAESVAGYALVLVLGNVLIIVLEALVVSIQTTRLVLFEFFTRFFVAQGRAFRPLAPPALSIEETLHEARS